MNRPVKIYGIYDKFSCNCESTDEKYHDLITDAFSMYVNGDFDKAIEIYKKIKIEYPILEDGKENSAHTHLNFLTQRCLETKAKIDSGEIEMWSGIYDFQIK